MLVDGEHRMADNGRNLGQGSPVGLPRSRNQNGMGAAAPFQIVNLGEVGRREVNEYRRK